MNMKCENDPNFVEIQDFEWFLKICQMKLPESNPGNHHLGVFAVQGGIIDIV